MHLTYNVLYYFVKGWQNEMLIDTNNMVSVSEANQNFSRISRMVDENGMAIILKNNTPKYVVLSFDDVSKNPTYYLPDNKAIEIASEIMDENAEVLKALAK